MAEETKEGEDAPTSAESAPVAVPKEGRFADLEALQQEIERRIRDNKRFLERFLDEDFKEDGEEDEEDDGGEDFEEL